MSQALSFEEIRRRALRAAAAAAGVSVLACSAGAAGGDVTGADGAGDSTLAGDVSVVGDSAAAGSDGIGDAAMAQDASADSGRSADAALVDTGLVDTGLADTADTTTVADTAVDDIDALDVAATDTKMSGDGGTSPDTSIPDTSKPDGGCADQEPDAPSCVDKLNTAEWATCCDDRYKWCNTKYGSGQQAASTCQFGADFSGSCTGCIPWGPPAPPRFAPSWRPRVVSNGPVFEVV